MTSDELFWRIVVATQSLEDALLLWWLAAIGADEEIYKEPRGTLVRIFGLTRQQIARTRQRLESSNLVRTKILLDRYTHFILSADALNELLGQTVMVNSDCAPYRFGPTRHDSAFDLPPFAAWSRLALIRRNRDEAILIAWLWQSDAHSVGVVATGHDVERRVLGFIERRTAMRAMARLADAGLVRIEPLGREGARYHLDAAAVISLLATFPFHEDAVTVLPGWSTLDFPLLGRIASSLAAEPSASSRPVANPNDPSCAAIDSLEAQT